jgi:hypothetical protein
MRTRSMSGRDQYNLNGILSCAAFGRAWPATEQHLWLVDRISDSLGQSGWTCIGLEWARAKTIGAELRTYGFDGLCQYGWLKLHVRVISTETGTGQKQLIPKLLPCRHRRPHQTSEGASDRDVDVVNATSMKA